MTKQVQEKKQPFDMFPMEDRCVPEVDNTLQTETTETQILQANFIDPFHDDWPFWK